MAVPAWSVYRSPSLLYLDSDDHVLEDLIQGVPDVEAAIGVRGAIVKDKVVAFRTGFRLPVVEIIGTLAKPLLLELGVRSSSLAWIS